MAVSPTELDYDRLVRSYVKVATGLPYVIPANSNAPAPTGSYATALLFSDDRNGFSSINSTFNDINDNFDYVINDNHEMIYSIQIYRASNALGLARQLSYYHQTPNGQYELQSRGLVIINWSTIRNIDLVTDGEYERRSSIDITFGLVSRTDQVVERLIESTINLDETDGINDINDTINITV